MKNIFINTGHDLLHRKSGEIHKKSATTKNEINKVAAHKLMYRTQLYFYIPSIKS